MNLILYILLSISFIGSESFSQILTVHHINVGQGDATLIRISNGKTVLIDAGNTGKGKNVVLPFLSNLGITSIDYLTASHYHADHIGGLDEAINGVSPDSIRTVYDRGGNAPLPSSKAFAEYWSAAEKTPKHSAIALGQIIQLSDNVTLRCLAVDGSALNYGEVQGSRNDENNLSVAWLLSFDHAVNGKSYSFRYFSGGDCGGVIGNYSDLETPLSAVVGDVDVVKIDHHGSRYSTNQTFLDSLQPEAVVISVGDRNTYGHPAQETLDRLQNAQSVHFIYQTETGNGGTAPKVKVFGTVTIAVYDSFYTAGTDTFQMKSQPTSQRNPVVAAVHKPEKFSNGEVDVTIENRVLVVSVVQRTLVSMQLFNLLGQSVCNLAESEFSPGAHHIDLAHFNLPTGTYFIRLSTPAETVTKKVIILR